MDVQLGLKENWKQFSLLVLVNAFVGGMVGLERSILPEIAEQEFSIAASSAILSFIVVFGITKALTNYLSGRLIPQLGRKNLLTIGWLFGLPVPLILMLADDWSWIVVANGLLGVNQGLCWSMTVIMKIDLAGSRNRGLAMGLNESAGYVAVGLVALLTGYIAFNYGVRPYPFYLGLIIASLGYLMSRLFVRDTHRHVAAEATDSDTPLIDHVFRDTSWKDPNLGSISQGGLVNNLNDAMVWGALPMVLASRGFDTAQIAQVAAIYPAVWGLGQLLTGKLADHANKKTMLVLGMLIQGGAIMAMAYTYSLTTFLALSAVLGVGTALVYPTFLAAIAEFTHPTQRAECIGVYRLWRDLGYAVGAILTGLLADQLGLDTSVVVVGVVTVISGLVILLRMKTP